jgi:hypothetical protein
VAAEFKASTRWERRFNRGLQRLRSELGKRFTKGYGVYVGDRSLRFDDVDVLPAGDFLVRLWGGEILK